MVEKVQKNQNYQDQSLEQILNNIKEVIINHSPNMDVLELTDRVTESQDQAKKSKVSSTKDNVSYLSHSVKKNTGQDPKILGAKRLVNFKAASESMRSIKNFLKAKEQHEVEKIALRSGLTLEELIIELLKPQLSDWLNKNLPDIVNNIVQREIKKLIPKDDE
jgi:cell pole-organizing protein PopZ